MKRFFHKPFRFAIIYSIILLLSASYVLLDTFVIPQPETPVGNGTALAATVMPTASSAVTLPSASASTDESSWMDSSVTPSGSAAPVITDSFYEDGNIRIVITRETKEDTAVFIADVQVSDVSYLKAAFANNTFGRNIKAATSEMAENSNAIFAVNGDYYGFRKAGYVLRNGMLYRSKVGSREDLVIDREGDFSIIKEKSTDAQTLVDTGVWQVFSFGPALVKDGHIPVNSKSEVTRSMKSNPRTAIGQAGPLHYIFVVSDGRTDESAGLSLLELAQVMEDHGCTVAYNLDGGGSSTMWFNGQIVNNPTDGRKSGERNISDIVYIGY